MKFKGIEVNPITSEEVAKRYKAAHPHIKHIFVWDRLECKFDYFDFE